MHQVEKVQTCYRVGTDKPEIQSVYVPLPFEKYVLLFNDESMQANTYDLFSDVTEYFFSEREDVKFVQVTNSPQSREVTGAYTIDGITHCQLAFLIKNAQLVISTDYFSPELCGIFDTPLIGLNGNRSKEIGKPFFTNDEIHTSLEGAEFPSFMAQEAKRAINNIMPEKVIAAACKYLGLDFKSPFTTHHVGSLYRNYLVEYIPDFQMPHDMAMGAPINIRLDLHDNIDNVLHAATHSQIQSVIFKDKVDVDRLLPISGGIFVISVELTLDTDLEFVHKLEELKASTTFFTKDYENISEIRLKFADYVVSLVNPVEKPDVPDGSVFKSSKLLLSGGNKYPCMASKIADSQSNEVIDSSEFWDESEHFIVYSFDK